MFSEPSRVQQTVGRIFRSSVLVRKPGVFSRLRTEVGFSRHCAGVSRCGKQLYSAVGSCCIKPKCSWCQSAATCIHRKVAWCVGFRQQLLCKGGSKRGGRDSSLVCHVTSCAVTLPCAMSCHAVSCCAAGVGKTAIVEGLAQRIIAGDVPPGLLGSQLLELDLAALAAGCMMPGEFEVGAFKPRLWWLGWVDDVP